MADTDKSLYSLRYNQLTSNLEAFGGGSPQWTLVSLNNVDPQQVPITRQINTAPPMFGGGNLTIDRTLSIPKATSSIDGYLAAVDWTTFNNKQPAGNYITSLTGDATAAGPGAAPLTLATVNGSVGTFTYAAITVNAKGLITSASSGVFGSLTDVGTDGITVMGGTGAVVGAGTSISQHVADASHNGYLASADWNTFNGKQPAGNYITALTGDVTASGPGIAASTLATVNANVGSFTYSSITVNAKGLITAASSGTAPVTSVSGTAGDISSTGGTTPVIDLVSTAVVPGSYTLASITVDAKGRITAASNGSDTDAFVTSVSGTANQITSTGGTTPVIAIASPLTTPGAVTVSGNITFTPTTNGIVGTTTNNNTSAGNVGEYVASVVAGSTAFPTSGTFGDGTSIILTAGDWEVTLVVDETTNTTTVGTVSAGIGQVAGNSASGLVYGDNRMDNDFSASATHGGFSIAGYRLSLSATTTIYYKIMGTWTGNNPTFGGRLSARRMR